MPTVPVNISKEEELKYVLLHFWDGLDFKDTLRSHNRDFIEQNFSNYTLFLANAPDEASRDEAVNALMKKAEADTAAYRLMADVAQLYLYDPNSPMLNEESYISFLKVLSNSPYIGEGQRQRNAYLLVTAQKNRSGMTAADFPFVTREGLKTTLHDFKQKGNLLLIFYDPDCDNCKEIIRSLSSNPQLKEMIGKGEVTVLAIYSGEEKDLWEKTSGELPEEWNVGFDNGYIDENDLYYFQASPTIYLLDENKKVLVKDLPPSQLL